MRILAAKILEIGWIFGESERERNNFGGFLLLISLCVSVSFWMGRRVVRFNGPEKTSLTTFGNRRNTRSGRWTPQDLSDQGPVPARSGPLGLIRSFLHSRFESNYYLKYFDVGMNERLSGGGEWSRQSEGKLAKSIWIQRSNKLKQKTEISLLFSFISFFE